MGLFDPFGMLVEHLRVVVNAAQSGIGDLLRRAVAREVEDVRFGKQLPQGAAGVEREGDQVGALREPVTARLSRSGVAWHFNSSTSRIAGCAAAVAK